MKKLCDLKKLVPEEETPIFAHTSERYSYKKHIGALETICLMLATINFELQKQHENMAVFDNDQNPEDALSREI